MRASFPRGSRALAFGVSVWSCGTGSGPSETTPDEVESCASPGSACDPESDDRGSRARFCAFVRDVAGDVSTQCTNVCANPIDFPAGSVGAGGRCEYDVDCGGGGTCDNDSVGGTASCTCGVAECRTDLLVGKVASFADGDFQGQPWRLVNTCRRADGACEQTDDWLALGQDRDDHTRSAWSYDCEGDQGCGELFEGRLCGADLAWGESRVVGEYSEGLWHFVTPDLLTAETTIYDRSGGEVVAQCLGSARRENTGSPEALVECDDWLPFGCLPAFDISGTYQQRYNCSSMDFGPQMCVDEDESGTLTFVQTGPNEWSFGDGEVPVSRGRPGSVHGHGRPRRYAARAAGHRGLPVAGAPIRPRNAAG